MPVFVNTAPLPLTSAVTTMRPLLTCEPPALSSTSGLVTVITPPFSSAALIVVVTTPAPTLIDPPEPFRTSAHVLNMRPPMAPDGCAGPLMPATVPGAANSSVPVFVNTAPLPLTSAVT
ncbi:MAG: hypothetical protein HZB53_18120, partial [Chloroflexi bacterium]|nr:hypothetical protein [Chloroflexota bacterium]